MATDSHGRYIIQERTIPVIFRCTKCDNARRYTLKRQISKRATVFVKENGREFPGTYMENTAVPPLLKCNKCSANMKGSLIKLGKNSDEPCDAACWNAKGDTCACSCKRKNHGINYK